MATEVTPAVAARPGWREVAAELSFLVRRAFLLAVVFGLVFTLAAIAIGSPQQPGDPFAPEVPGEAAPDEAKALHEEGVEFHPLPVLPDERN